MEFYDLVLSAARLFGSQIRIHATFFLLLMWIGTAAYMQGGMSAAATAVAFILAIFACVVAHEYGHVLMAKHFGIATHDITLLPIGGLARLERMPEEPWREIAVALAGPAVNFLITLVLIVILGARVDPGVLAIEDPRISFLARLAGVNLFLALFNLVPAFPMDGGRVLRALLSLRFDRTTATRYAATAGQALAFVFGFFGLVGGNPLLVFIAIFVYLAATAESREVAMTETTRSLVVSDGMITVFETLGPGATLANAADCLIQTTQQEFPVVDAKGRLEGFLTRNALFKALEQSDRTTPVRQVMQRNIPLVHPHERLDIALKKMHEARLPVIGVIDDEHHLIAYITPENLGELMMIHRAKIHANGLVKS